MSTNGALGQEASKFLTMVSKSPKTAGMFISMHHSHQDVVSTWNTTWFSVFSEPPEGGLDLVTNRQGAI